MMDNETAECVNWGLNTSSESEIFPSADYSNLFDLVIYGYLSPIVICITIVTHVPICVTLLQKNMRTPTGVFLLAITVADMLCGMSALPTFIYVFAMDHKLPWYRAGYTSLGGGEWASFTWCSMLAGMVPILLYSFHTISILLTVALAIQRCVYVCKPLSTRKMKNSVKKSVVWILAICFVGVLPRSVDWFNTSLAKEYLPSRIHSNTTVESCWFIHADWYNTDIQVVTFSLRLVFIQIIPCVTMVIVTVLLIRSMRVSTTILQHPPQLQQMAERKQIQERNRTTKMLVAVMIVFLLTELPQIPVVVLLVADLQPGFANIGISLDALRTLFIFLSSPVNCIIYNTMNKQFRKTFLGLFRRKQESKRKARSTSSLI